MRWLLAGVAVLAGLAVWGGQQAWRSYLETPLQLRERTLYEVPQGSSLGSVALDLAARGTLERPRWFVLYAKSRGDEGRIRAGEYALETGTTPVELLDLLVSGEVIQHAFTIIEGVTFADLRASLAGDARIVQTIDALGDVEIMRRLGQPEQHPEGQFLPETYYYTRGTNDLDLLARAHRLQTETLARLWAARDPDTLLKSPYEALVLASIIEKETALDSERSAISGVFHRRLQSGMRLQSDPTVIYGIGPAYDGDIRKRDLSTDTPYNTYTRHGLPPTPIAMPGAASIAAALNPASGTSLYFVATGDPDGSHYFSATLEEHNKAVQRYLARLRNKP